MPKRFPEIGVPKHSCVVSQAHKFRNRANRPFVQANNEALEDWVQHEPGIKNQIWQQKQPCQALLPDTARWFRYGYRFLLCRYHPSRSLLHTYKRRGCFTAETSPSLASLLGQQCVGVLFGFRKYLLSGTFAGHHQVEIGLHHVTDGCRFWMVGQE